jgi:hypothetical protein
MKVQDDSLVNYCKNCNFSITENYSKSAKTVIENKFHDDHGNYSQYVTPYIVYDSTLPRVNNIKCVNKDHKDDEVIVIKYDQANMKYLYYCVHCEVFWTTDNYQPFKAS